MLLVPTTPQLFQQSETKNPYFPLLLVLSSIRFNPTGQRQVVWAVRSSRLVAPGSFQIRSQGSSSWTLLHPMIAVATTTTAVFSPPRFVRSSRSIWIYLLRWMKISASLMIFKPPLCVSDCGSNGQLFFFFLIFTFCFFYLIFSGKWLKKKKSFQWLNVEEKLVFFVFLFFLNPSLC